VTASHCYSYFVISRTLHVAALLVVLVVS